MTPTEQILELGKAIHITLEWVDKSHNYLVPMGDGGWTEAWRTEVGTLRNMDDYHVKRMVLQPPADNDAAYASCLHEFGHVFNNHGHDPEDSVQWSGQHVEPTSISLRDEQDAWRWAINKALYWNAEMTKDLEYSLATYDKNKPIPSDIIQAMADKEGKTWQVMTSDIASYKQSREQKNSQQQHTMGRQDNGLDSLIQAILSQLPSGSSRSSNQ